MTPRAEHASVAATMRLVLATLALFLCSCVQDVCTRAKTLNTNFQARHAACFSEGTLTPPSFDATQCDGAMNACTKADEALLQGYFDCLEQLPVCTKQTLSTFNEKVLACANGMSALTPGCFQL